MARTTTELLAAIRAQGRIPVSEPEATDAILLAEADRQMALVFVPLTRKARAEWYLTWQDQDLVANQAAYSIPYRAISSAVRTVLWLPEGGQEIELSPVPVTAQHYYQPGTGMPCAYAVQDDRLILLPTPSSSQGSIRVFYERAPSSLVLTSACATVTSVLSSSATSIVLDVSGTAFTDNQVLDVVSARAPYSLLCESLVAQETAGDITLTRANDSRVPSAGDYLCLAEQSPIPQLPDELHPLLSLAVAAEWVLRVDQQAGMVLQSKLEMALGNAQSLLAVRQLGRRQKVKSQHSLMRRGGRGGNSFSDWTP